MRRATLVLVSAAVIGLAANLAVARDSNPGPAQASAKFVSHPGPPGPSHGHGGYGPGHGGYGYGGHGPHHHRAAPQILPIYPPLYPPPIYGVPIYRYPYPYYYGYPGCRPYSGFSYYGRGFGVSIAF